MQNILDFEKDYPDARVVLLEENYRSTKKILQAANEVIQHNRHRRPKNCGLKTQTVSRLFIIGQMMSVTRLFLLPQPSAICV
ncbi:hypothetical protein JZI48_10875 [Streptococcus equi subsp. equi]|nr:hypothetical protein JZI48_10875 [Streptococcus equi subsp. equi]